MSSKLLADNLNQDTTDDTLRAAFERYGNVLDARVMRDRETGYSRGFGFVTFSSTAEAEDAIAGLNKQDLDGSHILVTVANQNPTRGFDDSDGCS